jgi:hypothetical protein
MAINNFDAGWLPEVPDKVNSRSYMKEINSLQTNERNERLVNLFWDIEAVLRNPNITPARDRYLRNLRARVLKTLPRGIKDGLHNQVKSWKLARKTLIKKIPRRTKNQRIKRWENFISEDDPRRENKAFLYDLDGVKGELLDEVLHEAVPVIKVSEWSAHVNNVRAQNPGIGFKEALKLASETYIKTQPKPKPRRRQRVNLDELELPPMHIPTAKVSTVLQKRVRKQRVRKPRAQTKAQLASQVKSLTERLASLGFSLPEGSKRLDEPLLFPDFVSSPSKSPPRKQARAVRKLPSPKQRQHKQSMSEVQEIRRNQGITLGEAWRVYRERHDIPEPVRKGKGGGILRKIGNSRVFRKLKNIVY